MKRKRFIKLAMANKYDRNSANWLANKLTGEARTRRANVWDRRHYLYENITSSKKGIV